MAQNGAHRSLRFGFQELKEHRHHIRQSIYVYGDMLGTTDINLMSPVASQVFRFQNTRSYARFE